MESALPSIEVYMFISPLRHSFAGMLCSCVRNREMHFKTLVDYFSVGLLCICASSGSYDVYVCPLKGSKLFK